MKPWVEIEIGDLALQLHGGQPELGQRLRARYASSPLPSPAAAGGARCVLRVEVQSDPALPFDYDTTVQVEAGPPLVLRTGGAAGALELDAGLLRVAVSWQRPEHAAGSVENILRPAAQRVLLARRLGFLVHAASAVVAGRGLVCPGVSGAGKTTLSGLLAAAGHPVLSDDLSAVVLGAAGPRVVPSPFYGAGGPYAAHPGAPLAAVLFLHGRDRDAVAPLSAGQAAAHWMAHIPFLQGLPPPPLASLMQTLEALTRQVFHGELSFQRTPALAGLLLDEVQALTCSSD